jgi:transcriptional regulator with XRE-family HTH domain
MSKLSFGELIRKVRTEQELDLQSLSAQAEVSIATISRIEREEISVAEETGRKIIKALGTNTEIQERLVTALNKYRNDWTGAGAINKSGAMLDKMMRDHDISTAYLVKQTGKTKQAIAFWRQGIGRPSPEVLDTLIDLLSKAGAKQKDLAEYYRTYYRDVIMTSPQFSQIPPRKRRAAAEGFTRALWETA